MPAKEVSSASGTKSKWLHTFEIRFSRPDGFSFRPGQQITFIHAALRRDYTLLGPTDDEDLAVCVRHIPQGRFSPLLAAADPGDGFTITAPFGFFTYQRSPRPAVFIATGTGIAPFVAFARAGVRNFNLLHGVRTPAELYYAEELSAAAHRYIPCLSVSFAPLPYPHAFHGHVGDYLAAKHPREIYDFYLCGRSEMIRDVMRIIDEHYDGSRVFFETFF